MILTLLWPHWYISTLITHSEGTSALSLPRVPINCFPETELLQKESIPSCCCCCCCFLFVVVSCLLLLVVACCFLFVACCCFNAWQVDVPLSNNVETPLWGALLFVMAVSSTGRVRSIWRDQEKSWESKVPPQSYRPYVLGGFLWGGTLDSHEKT